MKKIPDVNGGEVMVTTYYRGGKRVVITLNPGGKDERDVVLDSNGTRDLLKELTDAL